MYPLLIIILDQLLTMVYIQYLHNGVNARYVLHVVVLVITPHACARGEAIGSVCLLSVCLSSVCLSSVCPSSIITKIAISEDSGITVISKHDQIVKSAEKLSSFCFFLLLYARHSP